MKRSGAALAAALLLPLPSFGQGSVLLVGGGGEDDGDWSDIPYAWLVDRAPNKRIAVLHYSTTSSFLPGYFVRLGADSAWSLAVPPSAVNDSAVCRAIVGCDGIFLRGGDQWRYVHEWKGSLVAQAVREVFDRGGVVGGTSAGAMVLSEVVFDARTTSVNPRTALRTPLAAGITLTDDFLALIPGTLVDTHFFERGRIGRLVPMVSLYHSQTGRTVTGVGIDANTALAVAADGTGEVMGSGTVTLIRLTDSSVVRTAPGGPFAGSNIGFDQLTTGFRVNLKSMVISPAGSAVPFRPVSGAPVPGPVIIDGSQSPADWFVAGGGLDLFLSVAGGTHDTVVVLGSVTFSDTALQVLSALESRGRAALFLNLDAAAAQDPAFAARILSSGGFILASRNPEYASALLDTTTLLGRACRDASDAGVAAFFPGDETLAAGESGVGSLLRHIYGAYYGYLTLFPGTGLLGPLIVMPDLFRESDYIDNRASGVFWAMGKSSLPFGVLLDAGSRLLFRGPHMTVSGPTPAMIIDARGALWVDFPAWRDPGKVNPRQNAALTGCLFHVVPAEFELPAGPATGVDIPRLNVPQRAGLDFPYPNPCNPHSVVRMFLPEAAAVSVELLDATGRLVRTVADGMYGAGTHTISIDGSGCATGVYLIRMRTPTGVFSRRVVLLR